MTAPSAAELEGDVSDLLVMLAETFPNWRITRTDTGWWATRRLMLDEDPPMIRAATPAELYVRLQDAGEVPVSRGAHPLLALLRDMLAAYDLETRLTGTTLLVIGPVADDQPRLSDAITCRPLPDDPDRLWFLTSTGEPLAPADDPGVAAPKIAAYLGG
ncbi:hypothetical protein [Actinomadura madurae]|uniref:hypothetical protein n=1 Tax=Actinomadura madurae TaxID=1993 RepID=UPI0020D23C64|nr:hypothetical protein [Actinomadura madurae]MCP9976535.1 hypothetical protein [Actinomadura madurae]MCQ0011967.1 hypothetical protein [Actinomadura madurae]